MGPWVPKSRVACGLCVFSVHPHSVRERRWTLLPVPAGTDSSARHLLAFVPVSLFTSGVPKKPFADSETSPSRASRCC